ncbi:MAG TPA: hypothetical protein VFY71_13405 [Planctomycetota bacterium]|nr:hypothetical protein [Planctomycetota bacterium]
MSARRVGPVWVLLVLLAILAWWLIQAPESAGSRPAEAAKLVRPQPTELPPAHFEAESPASATVAPLVDAPAQAAQPPATRTPAHLALVVVDDACAPVAGARVETWAEEDDDWEEGLPPLATLETDADGRCALPSMEDGGVLVATRKGVGSSGYVSVRMLRDLATPSGDAVVRLEPRSRLTGRVVEADDRPASDVEVHFWPFGGGGRDGRTPRPLRTDADGRFALEVDASALLGIVAYDGPRESNEVRYRTEAHGERDVLLRLPGNWTVGGIVFSRRSEPLAGIKVMLWRVIPEWFLPPEQQPEFLPNSRFDETVTGADGRFVFPLRERIAYTVIAFVPGELPTPAADVVIDAEHDHAFVELRPPEPSFIAGRVMDRSGAGVPDASVQAVTGTMWSPYERLYEPWPKDRWGEGGTARTDAQGAFRIEGLHPDGLYRVGLAGTIRDVRRPDPATDVRAGRSDVLMVQQEPVAKLSVTFTVRATSGAGILSDATITIYRLVEKGELVAQLKRETQADGRQRFTGLRAGESYSAMVEAPGLATLDVSSWIASPEASAIDVSLPRPATLDVDVRLAQGEPAAWADCRIEPRPPRHDMRGHVQRDADGLGRARFTHIDPGSLRLTVRAGGREARQDVDLGDGETRAVQIVLAD